MSAALSKPVAGALLLFVPLGALTALTSLALGTSDQRIVLTYLVTLIAALSVQMFSGPTGIMTFGHVAFMGVGAYVSALLTIAPSVKETVVPALPAFVADQQLPFLLTLPIAFAVGGILAALLGLVFTRMEEGAMAMATIALLLMFGVLAGGADDLTGGAQGLYGIPQKTTLLVALIGATLAFFLAQIFNRSTVGFQLMASRTSPLAARSLGIRLVRLRWIGWSLAGASIAVAGALWSGYSIAFSPGEFGLDFTFLLLAALVIGGISSATGTVVGVTLLTAITELIQRLEESLDLPGATPLALALIILLALYLRPRGILQDTELPELLGRRFQTPIWGNARQAAPPREGRGTEKLRKNGDRPRGSSLQLAGITKDFDGVRAVDNVSLTLNRGEILGLIGPNGSGKTTLLGVSSGILRPSAGRVSMDSRDVTGLPPEELARLGIGRTFQQIRLFGGFDVEQTVEIGALAQDRDDSGVEFAIAALELDEYREREATSLPYGVQRRVELARALAGDPSFLLLDEPAAGMTDEESDDLLATIRRLSEEADIGVLIVEHDMRLIMRLCDLLHVLSNGKTLAEGKPSEVAALESVQSAYMGSLASRSPAPN